MFRSSDSNPSGDPASDAGGRPSVRSPRAPQSTPWERRERGAWALASGAGLIRRGVITYVCALLLIAGLTIAGHFVTDSIVREQESTASVVNLSGRQRMLSQRIAKLALERAAHLNLRSDAEITGTLHKAIDLMAASHQALIEGSPEKHIRPPSAASLAVYNGKPYELDARIRLFLNEARRIEARSPETLNTQDPDLLALERSAQEPLLQALDAAVMTYQADSEESIKSLRNTLFVLALLMLVTLLAEALWLYRPIFKRLALAQQRLFEIGRTDPLTGCQNRRAFTQESQRALAAALLTDQPLSILMADIDHFKSVNDRFGHPAGDLVINSVVASLLRCSPENTIVGRMGGEEFAVMMLGFRQDQAMAAAERLRADIEGSTVHPGGDQGEAIRVTISIGLANLQPDSDTSVFQLLARADQALYKAKQAGRNRVCADTSGFSIQRGVASAS